MLADCHPNGTKETKQLRCPMCRLCFIAWTFGGRFNNGRCSFCKRMKLVWGQMTPFEQAYVFLPDSPPPQEKNLARYLQSSDYRFANSKHLEDAIY